MLMIPEIWIRGGIAVVGRVETGCGIFGRSTLRRYERDDC